MHAYCGCGKCRSERRARNAYKIEDEYNAPVGKSSKRKATAKSPGCSGNNGGSHIYVWVKNVYPKRNYTYNRKTGRYITKVFKGEFLERYVSTCIGCGKTNPKRRSWRYLPSGTEVYETRHLDIYMW